MLTCHSRTIDITPKESLFLTGFANRIGPSEGIHMPLNSSCFILKCKGSTFCFIANDFMELKEDLVKRIQKTITKQTSIPVSHIFVHCIHTHSAPIMDGMGLPVNQANNSYLENTIEAITSNAVNIFKDTEGFKACQLKVGKGRSTIGAHRRYFDKSSGKIINSTQLNILKNPVVNVLQFVDNHNKVLASLINYACHPVSLGPQSHCISPDFVGKTREVVEKKWGGTTIFFNGAAGDINPIGDLSNDITNTNKLGVSLGEAVLDCSFESFQVETIVLKKGMVNLPFEAQNITPTFIQEQAKKKREENTGFNGWVEKIDSWASGQKKFLGKSTLKGKYLQIGVLKMGPVIIIFCQGELFSSYHKAFREHFSNYIIFLIGYTNGESGYIPDKEAFELGGYEVEQAYIFFDEPSPLHSSTDTILKKTVIALINQVIIRD